MFVGLSLSPPTLFLRHNLKFVTEAGALVSDMIDRVPWACQSSPLRHQARVQTHTCSFIFSVTCLCVCVWGAA